MTADWKNSVNQISGSQRINDINEYIKYDEIKEYNSPIDNFYFSLKGILDVVKDPKILEENKSLGPLLLIGIVSNTENYFREIMSQMIKTCPICKSTASSQSINLGSVIWHSGNNIEIGSFENLSFADSKVLKKTCKSFLDYDIDKKGATAAALDEFDKICELRHGIVHSNQIIAGKNAIKLGINPSQNPVKIYVDYKLLQECAVICTSVICSFNLELFNEIVRRWAIDWCKLPSWIKEKDNIKFKIIWKAFYSQIDRDRGSIPLNLTELQCRNSVKKTFNKD
jgi:hypothetical protein